MAMTLFVPGRLENPLNGSWGGWRKHATLARRWRDRTTLAVYVATGGAGVPWPPAVPKRITFTVQTGARWDDDAIPGACKPLRDAMVDAKIIDDDGPRRPPEFLYAQEVKRYDRGVRITVAPLAGDGAGA